MFLVEGLGHLRIHISVSLRNLWPVRPPSPAASTGEHGVCGLEHGSGADPLVLCPTSVSTFDDTPLKENSASAERGCRQQNERREKTTCHTHSSVHFLNGLPAVGGSVKGEWPLHKRPGNEFLCIRMESREKDRENSSNKHVVSAGWIRNPISLNVSPLTAVARRD